MKKIAIFASGGGSNARKIMGYFADSAVAKVAVVVCNKKGAGVLGIAAEFGVPVISLDRNYFYQSEALVEKLQLYDVDLLVLAGFLWLIPPYLVRAFPQAIVNIHPALLPHYGGAGMYGHHVHEAVHKAAEQESGMTIHWVNEHYDEGEILFQARCSVDPSDSPETIAAKVLELEHRHYAPVIEQILLGKLT